MCNGGYNNSLNLCHRCAMMTVFTIHHSAMMIILLSKIKCHPCAKMTHSKTRRKTRHQDTNKPDEPKLTE